jgi:nucleotide-binding universal stress UspA family protein
MKKKILIPTDFSKNAWNAIAYAASLYKDKACAFYILNAYGSATYATGEMMLDAPGTTPFQSEKRRSEIGLENVLDMIDIDGKNPKHTYTFISESNNLLSAMQEVIKKKDIELAVMGTKGASDVENKFFGSNTIVITEKLRKCPILGVPLDAQVFAIKEIVLPTSYKTHFKRKEIMHLVEIAQLHHAEVCVLHVSKKEGITKELQENQVLLKECLDGASYSFHYVSGSNVAYSVKLFVESRGSDMIAFINKKHAFFDSVFTTPLVSELGMFSKVPLLVMHDMRN